MQTATETATAKPSAAHLRAYRALMSMTVRTESDLRREKAATNKLKAALATRGLTMADLAAFDPWA